MTRKNESVPVWNAKLKHWRYRVYIDGKQRNFFSRLPGRKGETECYLKAEDAVNRNQPLDTAKIGELWARYEKHIEAYYGTSSDGLRSAKSYGKNHILPKCKHKRLNQMSTLDWQEIIDQAKPVKRKYKTKTTTLTLTKSGQLSKKTLQNLRSEIVAFLKWCRRGELTTLNPELLIPLKREKVVRSVLTTAEGISLVRTRISSNPALHAFRLQIALGLRPSEVLALKWTDIQGEYLKVQRGYTDKNTFSDGKNENAIRLEYLHPLTTQILSDQQKFLDQQNIKSEFIFPHSNGSVASQAMYRRQLKNYCNENGFTEITPYRLRHSFISIMRSRLDEETIKAIVGHSDSMDTFGVYDAELKENIALRGMKAGAEWEKLLTGS